MFTPNSNIQVCGPDMHETGDVHPFVELEAPLAVKVLFVCVAQVDVFSLMVQFTKHASDVGGFWLDLFSGCWLARRFCGGYSSQIFFVVI